MIEVVDRLFDDFWIISIAKIVKIALVGLAFEVKNTRNRFLSIRQTIDTSIRYNRLAGTHLE